MYAAIWRKWRAQTNERKNPQLLEHLVQGQSKLKAWRTWKWSIRCEIRPEQFQTPSDRQCKAVHKSTIQKVEVGKIKEEKNREQKSKQVVQMTPVFDLNIPLFRTLQKMPTPNLILPFS